MSHDLGRGEYLKLCCRVCLPNIWDKIIKSSVKDKEEFVVVVELCGNEDGKLGTEKWINSIDRGGLWHVNRVYLHSLLNIGRQN